MTPIALTIAGSDSGGGAGIQADLKTFSALGVYGASVITALTAQNTKGVTAIHDVPAEFVAAQMDAVFSDLEIGAVKIGMVSQRPVIEAIAAGLKRCRKRRRCSMHRPRATRPKCASKPSVCSRWGRSRCWSRAVTAAAPRAPIC